MSTAHLAISHWIPWKSAIVLPKAARCCTYSVAYISAPSANPMPAGRHDGAHGVEAQHGQAEATHLADHVLGGHMDVGQDELSGVDPADAHLVVGATDLHALPRPLDDERRHRVVGPAGRIAGLGEHRVPVRLADPRHPAFGAVEHPAALGARIGHASGPHTHDVAAGLGFREPEGRPQRALADPRQVRCFCSSVPAIMTGPVGSRVSSSIRAAVLEYLAISSMAMASPRIPAPEPPYSTGMHRPSRPASRKASKTSVG